MIRVLLVENDEPHMRLMAWVLRQEGFDVDATSSADASARTGEVQPNVIVFNTSEDDGAKSACVQQLRQASAVARIIDLGPESESPDHQSGADAYLNMPVTAAELKATIERLAAS